MRHEHVCKGPSRPNVVLVITDDQGYGDLGCHGNPVVRTPHIDAFHQASVRLTNFHVGPTCAPTRAGLLTGHYANSTGVWHTIGGRSLLREDEWTLAAALQGAGYRTGIFGKWHLGDAYPYRPQDRGFDTAVVHGGGGITQTPDYWGNDYFDDTYFVNGKPQAFDGYCTDVWFDEALKFIEAQREAPFFCYIATNAPHEPYNVEPKYSDPYRGTVSDDQARFFGMITNIDENFGLLRTKLQEWGLEENTILIFMTDNGTSGGCSIDRNGFVTEGYNAGLRGKKGSAYDGGHRVPFFLRWPGGGLDAARDVDTLTANVDVMPTLLDLCGVEIENGRSFHGMGLTPLLRSEAVTWPERAVVTDSQRVARPEKWRQSAVMTQSWRLIDGRELYDAVSDREQRHDVAADHPDVVTNLREEYDRWWELVSTQFDRDVPIALGAVQESVEAERGEEVCLTAHDWRNDACDCPWNQGHIRAGTLSNGYWEVNVVQPGEYRVELRRWPKEVDRPITAGITGDDVAWRKAWIPERAWSRYTGGKALPLTGARLRIGDREYTGHIEPDDPCVTFTVTLEPGSTSLQTWFTDGEELSLGAYYLYVRRVRGPGE